jgi:hypothetical protein
MHSKSSPVLAFHFAFEETCYFGQQIFYLLIAACSTKSSGMKCDQHERFESGFKNYAYHHAWGSGKFYFDTLR